MRLRKVKRARKKRHQTPWARTFFIRSMVEYRKQGIGVQGMRY